MPPNRTTISCDVEALKPLIAVAPAADTPTQSEDETSSISSEDFVRLDSTSNVLYEKIQIPIEQNLRELVVSTVLIIFLYYLLNTNDLSIYLHLQHTLRYM